MVSRTVKILLADEHPVVLAGLRAAVLRDGVDICRTVSSPVELRRFVAIERPDVVVLDLVFDDDVHLSLVRDCRRLVPAATIVVFTALAARNHRRLALDAGADAFLEKTCSLDDLALYLLPASAGRLGSAADPDLSVETIAETFGVERPGGAYSMLLRHTAARSGAALRDIPIPNLTAREREVARLLSTGRPISEIAGSIGVGVKTAAVHRDNLRKKMQCRDTNELIARLARIYASAS